MKKLFWLCLLVGLTGTRLHAQQTPYVVLVSFDGFRHDYVKQFDLPNFKAFISKGSQSKGLIPVFPSKTFPNHYSIVTGLYSGHHGLVDNTFFDPSRRELYTMKSKERVTDPYYYTGTPLWKLVRQGGLKSASYFWVGSEIPQEGLHPDYYFPYDEDIPFESRVDQVLKWLSLPVEERPHFITLYFSSPDHESHDHGPLGEETRKAALKVDSLLGRLMDGLSKLDFEVNVILVSDHGMKELTVTNETYIFLDELLNLDDSSIEVANGGTQAHVYLNNPAKIDSVYLRLLSTKGSYQVLKRKDFPERWHYNNVRSGDLLILAEPGHYIKEKDRNEFMKSVTMGGKFGVHGYDPKKVKDMYGIFYAQGPNIETGLTIPPFENIHVYPLIARILKLSIPAIDGKVKTLEKIHKP